MIELYSGDRMVMLMIALIFVIVSSNAAMENSEEENPFQPIISKIFPQCIKQSELDGPCEDGYECHGSAECQFGVCVCGDEMIKRFAPGGGSICVFAPLFGEECEEGKCSSSLMCDSESNTCVCQPPFERQGALCTPQCQQGEVRVSYQCLKGVIVGESCDMSAQCTTAYSHCDLDNKKCACISGTEQQDSACVPVSPKCLDGSSPVENDGEVVKCVRTPGLFSRIMAAALRGSGSPPDASLIEVDRLVPLISQIIKDIPSLLQQFPGFMERLDASDDPIQFMRDLDVLGLKDFIGPQEKIDQLNFNSSILEYSTGLSYLEFWSILPPSCSAIEEEKHVEEESFDGSEFIDETYIEGIFAKVVESPEFFENIDLLSSLADSGLFDEDEETSRRRKRQIPGQIKGKIMEKGSKILADISFGDITIKDRLQNLFDMFKDHFEGKPEDLAKILTSLGPYLLDPAMMPIPMAQYAEILTQNFAPHEGVFASLFRRMIMSELEAEFNKGHDEHHKHHGSMHHKKGHPHPHRRGGPPQNHPGGPFPPPPLPHSRHDHDDPFVAVPELEFDPIRLMVAVFGAMEPPPSEGCPQIDQYCTTPVGKHFGPGVCCQKPELSCPVGESPSGVSCSLFEVMTNSDVKFCPLMSHHCHSITLGSVKHSICCPRECPLSMPLRVGDKCLPLALPLHKCEHQDQCAPGITNMQCFDIYGDGVARCGCPEGSEIIQGKCDIVCSEGVRRQKGVGKCLEPVESDEQCVEDEQCPLGQRCDGDICSCQPGMTNVDGECINSASCPHYAGFDGSSLMAFEEGEAVSCEVDQYSGLGGTISQGGCSESYHCHMYSDEKGVCCLNPPAMCPHTGKPPSMTECEESDDCEGEGSYCHLYLPTDPPKSMCCPAPPPVCPSRTSVQRFSNGTAITDCMENKIKSIPPVVEWIVGSVGIGYPSTICPGFGVCHEYHPGQSTCCAVNGLAHNHALISHNKHNVMCAKNEELARRCSCCPEPLCSNPLRICCFMDCSELKDTVPLQCTCMTGYARDDMSRKCVPVDTCSAVPQKKDIINVIEDIISS